MIVCSRCCDLHISDVRSASAGLIWSDPPETAEPPRLPLPLFFWEAFVRGGFKMKTLCAGDKIKLIKDASLMAGWRGVATVISQAGDSVKFRKPDGGIAEALRDQVICIRRSVK